jgi:hypothetical protein
VYRGEEILWWGKSGRLYWRVDGHRRGRAKKRWDAKRRGCQWGGGGGGSGEEGLRSCGASCWAQGLDAHCVLLVAQSGAAFGRAGDWTLGAVRAREIITRLEFRGYIMRRWAPSAAHWPLHFLAFQSLSPG